MDPSKEASTDSENVPAQWPARPRLVSPRGCAVAILGLVFASVMSLAIVRTRNMPTAKTAPFWGPEASAAIRVGRPVELLRPEGSLAVPELDFYNEGWIDLTELRDLGYFRRVFLADNNFDWQSQGEMKIPVADAAKWPWAFVRFGQTDDEAAATTIAIHLDEGWVGFPGGGQAVRLTDSVLPRIAYRLRLFAKVASESVESAK
ncbi:hypothetical protein Poly24_49020 [Rosistilla carotiformis]|uniref:Uncharacterized protein n=1 Tax=Rosistilla carotiformis TaxID=2528017 RepID=A0A518K047_9BACT|nr:hypothetical protein [Rosistilla carotiformis]QDV71168.1 hypothetical protein Poly24_49020 [Rosistilla carotiformis]